MPWTFTLLSFWSYFLNIPRRLDWTFKQRLLCFPQSLSHACINHETLMESFNKNCKIKRHEANHWPSERTNIKYLEPYSRQRLWGKQCLAHWQCEAITQVYAAGRDPPPGTRVHSTRPWSSSRALLREKAGENSSITDFSAPFYVVLSAFPLTLSVLKVLDDRRHSDQRLSALNTLDTHSHRCKELIQALQSVMHLGSLGLPQCIMIVPMALPP